MFVIDDRMAGLDAILRTTPLLEGDVRSEAVEKVSSVFNISLAPICCREAVN